MVVTDGIGAEAAMGCGGGDGDDVFGGIEDRGIRTNDGGNASESCAVKETYRRSRRPWLVDAGGGDDADDDRAAAAAAAAARHDCNEVIVVE